MRRIVAEIRTLIQITNRNYSAGKYWYGDDSDFAWQWSQYEILRKQLQEYDPNYFSDIRVIPQPKAEKGAGQGRGRYYPRHLKTLLDELVRISNLIQAYETKDQEKVPGSELYKIKIQIENVRTELGEAYNSDHSPMRFDVMKQAYLHCTFIAGVSVQYGQLIIKLEELEEQLESMEGVIVLPRWRVRRKIMQDLIDSGRITGDDNIARSATFMQHIDEKLSRNEGVDESELVEDNALLSMLHPIVINSSWSQFKSGHLRDAVLDAIIAVYDLIRSRTGLQIDGSKLAERALSVDNPLLVLSEVTSDSGKNDQIGFMKIISGAYQGIRNTKAHTLEHDLDPVKTSQYLVFASLLARRIDEASVIINDPS